MAKVIKLTDNNNNTLLPVTDASYIQMKVGDDVRSVKDVIIENEEITALALNDLHSTKQEKLISGVTIKSINDESLIGSGNIELPEVYDVLFIQSMDGSTVVWSCNRSYDNVCSAFNDGKMIRGALGTSSGSSVVVDGYNFTLGPLNLFSSSFPDYCYLTAVHMGYVLFSVIFTNQISPYETLLLTIKLDSNDDVTLHITPVGGGGSNDSADIIFNGTANNVCVEGDSVQDNLEHLDIAIGSANSAISSVAPLYAVVTGTSSHTMSPDAQAVYTARTNNRSVYCVYDNTLLHLRSYSYDSRMLTYTVEFINDTYRISAMGGDISGVTVEMSPLQQKIKYKRQYRYGTSGTAVRISDMLPDYVYIASGNASGNLAAISSLTISTLNIPDGYDHMSSTASSWVGTSMPVNDSKVLQYCVIFQPSADDIPITLPSGVTWAGGECPPITSGKQCEIIIMNSLATLITNA